MTKLEKVLEVLSDTQGPACEVLRAECKRTKVASDQCAVGAVPSLHRAIKKAHLRVGSREAKRRTELRDRDRTEWTPRWQRLSQFRQVRIDRRSGQFASQVGSDGTYRVGIDARPWQAGWFLDHVCLTLARVKVRGLSRRCSTSPAETGQTRSMSVVSIARRVSRGGSRGVPSRQFLFVSQSKH